MTTIFGRPGLDRTVVLEPAGPPCRGRAGGRLCGTRRSAMAPLLDLVRRGSGPEDRPEIACHTGSLGGARLRCPVRLGSVRAGPDV